MNLRRKRCRFSQYGELMLGLVSSVCLNIKVCYLELDQAAHHIYVFVKHYEIL